MGTGSGRRWPMSLPTGKEMAGKPAGRTAAGYPSAGAPYIPMKSQLVLWISTTT